MNRKMLINRAYTRLKTQSLDHPTKGDVKKSIDMAVDVIIEALSNKEVVQIATLGTFYYKKWEPRQVYDLARLKPMTVGPRVTLKFRPSKALKEVINKEMKESDNESG